MVEANFRDVLMFLLLTILRQVLKVMMNILRVSCRDTESWGRLYRREIKIEHDFLLVFSNHDDLASREWENENEELEGGRRWWGKNREREEMKHKNHINNFITTNEGNSHEYNSGTGLMNKMTIKWTNLMWKYYFRRKEIYIQFILSLSTKLLFSYHRSIAFPQVRIRKKWA